MRAIRSVLSAGAAVLLMSAAAHGQAVPGESRISIGRGQFDLEPFAGYLVSQNFLDGPFGTTIGSMGATFYGVKVGVPLAPNGSLVGTIAYADGSLEAGLPIIGGISFGSSETYVYDVGVELRAGNMLRGRGMRFIPFAQLGGGAIHRRLTVSGVSAKGTNFEMSGALGADIPVMRNVAVRVMAKDYWGKADFGSLGPLDAKTKELHTVALTGGVRVTF
jgi:hypothetical protein